MHVYVCFMFVVAHGTAGPSLCFWRAATDNDRAGWPTLLNFVVDHRLVGLLSKFLPLSRLRYGTYICMYIRGRLIVLKVVTV